MPKGKLRGDVCPPKGGQTVGHGKIQPPKCKPGSLERRPSPGQKLSRVNVLHDYLLSFLDVLGPKVRGRIWRCVGPKSNDQGRIRSGRTQRQPRGGHGTSRDEGCGHALRSSWSHQKSPEVGRSVSRACRASPALPTPGLQTGEPTVLLLPPGEAELVTAAPGPSYGKHTFPGPGGREEGAGPAEGG